MREPGICTLVYRTVVLDFGVAVYGRYPEALEVAMANLLRTIQESALDPKIDVADMLLQAKVLAARLGHVPLAAWVGKELNGYSSDDDLPAYRKFSVQSYGNFYGMFGRSVKNAPIPPMLLPDRMRHIATEVRLYQGVRFCSSLAEEAASEGGQVRLAWPNNALALEEVTSAIYEEMTLGSAWTVLPAGSVKAMLDTLRSRILDFVLAIEAENPEAGDARPGTEPIPTPQLNQFYNTYIAGGMNTLAIASTGVSQSVNQVVKVNDLDALRRFLGEQGISDDDLDALEEAIEHDTPPSEPGKFGPRVADWFGKMLAKAATGAWTIGSQVAAQMLTIALCNYYGIQTPGS